MNSGSNAIRLELNRFLKAGMLLSSSTGNKRFYQVNQKHPLYRDLHSILLKYVGIDRLIESVTSSLGDVEGIYLIGDYANGKDSGVIDVVLMGDVDLNYLAGVINRVEGLISRKVRYLIFSKDESLKEFLNDQNFLVLWQK